MKEIDEYSYIDIIKQIITNKKLNQQKFADLIGVNQTTVSQWLLGRKKPTYNNILEICKVFDITPNDFFGF